MSVDDKPEFIKMNEKNQPHCVDGPFCRLPGGFELYYLNGVKMEKWHVMTPAEKIDPIEIIKETNVDVRRELLRKVGMKRFVKKCGAQALCERGDYKLFQIEIRDATNIRYLQMRNPSIGVWHFEIVHPTCNTIQEAINYRRYGDDFKNKQNWLPDVLT